MGIPATEGNRVTILRNGGEIFPSMLDTISTAADTSDFLTFVYWNGVIGVQFAERLAGLAMGGERFASCSIVFGRRRLRFGELVETAQARAARSMIANSDSP